MASDPTLAHALVDLAGGRHTHADARDRVPKSAGLYAFYGDEQAWSDLDLSPVFDDQPLYVGKAEKSLNGRDVGTHFATGKTGSSTVRRSLAALLVTKLGLVAVPRNLVRPDGSANYSLEPPGDERLSRWMEQRLLLATWVKPEHIHLDEVETAVLLRLRPPLNLDKVGEPRERLRRGRGVLAAESRKWPIDPASRAPRPEE
jgi:hypothetical protein